MFHFRFSLTPALKLLTLLFCLAGGRRANNWFAFLVTIPAFGMGPLKVGLPFYVENAWQFPYCHDICCFWSYTTCWNSKCCMFCSSPQLLSPWSIDSMHGAQSLLQAESPSATTEENPKLVETLYESPPTVSWARHDRKSITDHEVVWDRCSLQSAEQRTRQLLLNYQAPQRVRGKGSYTLTLRLRGTWSPPILQEHDRALLLSLHGHHISTIYIPFAREQPNWSRSE